MFSTVIRIRCFIGKKCESVGFQCRDIYVASIFMGEKEPNDLYFGHLVRLIPIRKTVKFLYRFVSFFLTRTNYIY